MDAETEYLSKFVAKLSYAHVKLAIDSFYTIDDVARHSEDYEDKCFINRVSALNKLVALAKKNIGIKTLPQDEKFTKFSAKGTDVEIDYSDKEQVCDYVVQLGRRIEAITPENIKENNQKLVSAQVFLSLNSLQDSQQKAEALHSYSKFIGDLGITLSSKKERLEAENNKTFRDVRLSESACDKFFVSQLKDKNFSHDFISLMINETSKYMFENSAYTYYGAYVDDKKSPLALQNIADKKADARFANIKKHLAGKTEANGDELLKEQYNSFFADKECAETLHKFCATIEMHHEEDLKPLRFITPQYKINQREAEELSQIKTHLFARQKEAFAAYKTSASKVKPVTPDVKPDYKVDNKINKKLISELKTYHAN